MTGSLGRLYSGNPRQKEVMIPSSFTGTSPELFEMSENDQSSKKMKKFLLTTITNHHVVPGAAQANIDKIMK